MRLLGLPPELSEEDCRVDPGWPHPTDPSAASGGWGNQGCEDGTSGLHGQALKEEKVVLTSDSYHSVSAQVSNKEECGTGSGWVQVVVPTAVTIQQGRATRAQWGRSKHPPVGHGTG